MELLPLKLSSPLYTADTSGIVHVAANSDQSVFTLGQFFAEWQVPLSRGRLGGLRAAPSAPVAVYLDGSPVASAGLSASLTAGRPSTELTLHTIEIGSRSLEPSGAQPIKSLVRLVPQPKLIRTRPAKCR